MSQSYFKVVDSISYYWEHAHWLLKLLAFAVAWVYSSLLLLIGVVFYLGIVFDWLGKLTGCVN